jgi:osmotically-inducible protein OsmY
MAGPTTVLILPTRETTVERQDALQATAPLSTPSLEDLRLAERVEHALRATGYESLRVIQVTVQARLIILGGRVPTYYLKQVAQTTALAVPGAQQIRNGLEVGRRG